MTFRIASWNIRKGGRRRRRAIASVLQSLDPDVAVLQEATDPAVVRWLAEATGSLVALHRPGRSVAVLSRVAWDETRWHRLPTGRLFIEVESREPAIRMLGVHLSAGLSRRGERRRSREIDHVLAVAAASPAADRTLIAGDLNAIAPSDLPRVSSLPAWIRLLLRIDGGIGTSVVRRVLEHGYGDAFRTFNPSDPGATMPAGAPSVRLDYLMLAPGLVPAASGCRIGGVDPSLVVAASDHLPVVLDLDLDGLA